MRNAAIYAGTFDPLTLGHLDVVRRAASIFDRLVVGISKSRMKSPLFTLEERLDLVTQSVKDIPNVEVQSFSGLLVDFARSQEIKVVVRGLRAISDFEIEFQMALTNRKMDPEVETLFLMPKDQYSYLSSSMVREVAEHGGDSSVFVPPVVHRALLKKFGDPAGE